uniref:Uncharacterized protein n=1 Tax=Poecilia mexicana TaxID=48701 RepID=A0A3B3Z0W7_9TELE
MLPKSEQHPEPEEDDGLVNMSEQETDQETKDKLEMPDYPEHEQDLQSEQGNELEQYSILDNDPQLDLYGELDPEAGDIINLDDEPYQSLAEYPDEGPEPDEILFEPPFHEDTPLTPSFIITSSPTKEPVKHEVSANNVIIVDPRNDFTFSSKSGNDNTTSGPVEWCSEENSSNLIILETSNLIIRSASEFSLNKTCEEPQEKMFLNNPFFKLRSRSTISLVDEEIRMVKQREEELRKERATLYGKDMFSTETGLSNRMDTLTFDTSGIIVKYSIHYITHNILCLFIIHVCNLINRYCTS